MRPLNTPTHDTHDTHGKLGDALERICSSKGLGRLAVTGAMITALGLPAIAAKPAVADTKTVTKEVVNIKAPRVRVVDYPSGFKKDTPKRLKKAGVKIVVRYVGYQKGKSSWKNLRKWEVNELKKNGIDIATVYETSASWMRGGYHAGMRAAQLAKADIKAVGGPDKPFVYFACDEDAKYYNQVNAALRGAAHVLDGDHVGIYGGYEVVKRAIESGAAAKGWQTVAWSQGRVYKNLALYQTVKLYDGNLGLDYDSNFAKKDDIGQWGRKTVTYTVSDGKAEQVKNTSAEAPAVATKLTVQKAPTRSTLNALASRDAEKAWAVGQNGTIVHTSDGGKRWVRQVGPTNATLNDVQFTDDMNGWAVGTGGTVFHTADGGKTWDGQSTPTHKTLRSVAFKDASVGVAVGNSGTVIRTTDGGVTWLKQSSNTTATLTSVRFMDRNNAVAVGAHGTVLRTDNCGWTWTGGPVSATKATLTAVDFTDSRTGWIVGGQGTILRTTDGGSSWSTQSAPTKASLYSVHFADSSKGQAVGLAGTVLYTSDGGSTWSRQPAPTIRPLVGVQVDDSSATKGWAVGGAGTILRSTQAAPTKKMSTGFTTRTSIFTQAS